MALRHTEEEQAVFDHTLELVAEQGPLAQEEVDTLSMLEGADLARFQEGWARLPAAPHAVARATRARTRRAAAARFQLAEPPRARRQRSAGPAGGHQVDHRRP